MTVGFVARDMKVGDDLIGDLSSFLFHINLILFLLIGESEHATAFAR